MSYSKDYSENKNGAVYSSRCNPSTTSSALGKMDYSSILIIAWVVLQALLSIITPLYTKFVDGWYDKGTPAMMIYMGICIVHNLINILPAIAIKNLILKIVGIVIMSALILWWISQNILWAMHIR